MPVATVCLFILFGLFAVVGTIGNILHARAKELLISKGYVVDGFWARPYRDLTFLRQLISAESDPKARIRYLRLQRALYLSTAICYVLMIALFVLGIWGMSNNARFH